MFVVALEDSIILEISSEKEQALKEQNHKFETFSESELNELPLLCNKELFQT